MEEEHTLALGSMIEPFGGGAQRENCEKHRYWGPPPEMWISFVWNLAIGILLKLPQAILTQKGHRRANPCFSTLDSSPWVLAFGYWNKDHCP